MRVLMLNERDLAHPLAGGVEVHLEETASRLAADHGIETTVLCAGFPGAAPEERRRGIRFVRLGNRYSYYALLPGRARTELRAAPYDLVVENLCKLIFFSQTYLHGVPRLGLVHHLFGWSAFRQVSPAIAAFVVAQEALLPLAYRRWPMVVVSPSTRDDLIRRGLSPESIRVIPNGLDHQRYRPGAPSAVESDRVVYVGRVEHYKGVDVLLDAWPSVVARRPGARLEILGSGTALEAMRARIAASGAARGVTFHGFVSEEEKVAWLQRATVGVQPSRKEGWGLTVLEANACGTPVVAADVPGLRDSVRPGETGLLVPSLDPAALGASLCRVLDEPELRERLARGARAWARRFDWDSVGAELAAVLRAAARRSPLPETADFLAAPGPGGQGGGDAAVDAAPREEGVRRAGAGG